MTNKEEILKCSCVALGTIITIYLIYYIVRVRQKQYEGLTMDRKESQLPSEILSTLKKRNDRLDSDLQIEKYRDSYEDMIIHYEELYYLDTIQKMLNATDNDERRQLLADNSLDIKGLDETAKFIYNH